jgi:hypothetical protein
MHPRDLAEMRALSETPWENEPEKMMREVVKRFIAHSDALTAELDAVRKERDEWAASSAFHSNGRHAAESEVVALKHDVERHYNITCEQANEIVALKAALGGAREKALEEAAQIVDGLVVGGRYVSWPCWNPKGNVAHDSEPARLTLALAVSIRALAVKP